jgi:hypothetical protein
MKVLEPSDLNPRKLLLLVVAIATLTVSWLVPSGAQAFCVMAGRMVIYYQDPEMTQDVGYCESGCNQPTYCEGEMTDYYKVIRTCCPSSE